MNFFRNFSARASLLNEIALLKARLQSDDRIEDKRDAVERLFTLAQDYPLVRLLSSITHNVSDIRLSNALRGLVCIVVIDSCHCYTFQEVVDGTPVYLATLAHHSRHINASNATLGNSEVGLDTTSDRGQDKRDLALLNQLIELLLILMQV